MDENTNKKSIYCARCGRLIAEVSEEEYDDLINDTNGFYQIGGQDVVVCDEEVWCDDCAEDRFARCYECGEFIDKRYYDYNYDEDGEIYCQDCTDRYLSWCERCESYGRHDTFPVLDYRGNDVYWCDDCRENHATRCDNCGDYFETHNRTFFETHDHQTICGYCRDDYFYRCEGCGELVHEDDAYCDEETDDHFCPACWRSHCDADVIYGYHTYPTDWQFRNLSGSNDFTELMRIRMNEAHIGTELEIDNGGRNGKKAIEITTALGYPANESREFKCSRDGSLNNGFEIISMPATMEYHLTKYNWQAGMEKARQLGYGSHDPNTCGLHFHIDRQYFHNSMTMPEEGYIIVVTNNWSWLEPFSRRTSFSYCAFRGSTQKFTPDSFKSENAWRTQERLDDLRSAYRGHNVALNFSGNSTIEVRFIRGTLKYSTFVASLQLMEMLAYAVKHFRKEQLANIDLKWFKRFAKRRSYVAFLSYLEARGIMA